MVKQRMRVKKPKLKYLDKKAHVIKSKVCQIHICTMQTLNIRFVHEVYDQMMFTIFAFNEFFFWSINEQ